MGKGERGVGDVTCGEVGGRGGKVPVPLGRAVTAGAPSLRSKRSFGNRYY